MLISLKADSVWSFF